MIQQMKSDDPVKPLCAALDYVTPLEFEAAALANVRYPLLPLV